MSICWRWKKSVYFSKFRKFPNKTVLKQRFKRWPLETTIEGHYWNNKIIATFCTIELSSWQWFIYSFNATLAISLCQNVEIYLALLTRFFRFGRFSSSSNVMARLKSTALNHEKRIFSSNLGYWLVQVEGFKSFFINSDTCQVKPFWNNGLNVNRLKRTGN